MGKRVGGGRLVGGGWFPSIFLPKRVGACIFLH